MSEKDKKMSADEFLLAAQKGDLAALEKGLAEGMDVNVRDAYGNHALMYAAAAGQPKAVNFLVERGIDKENTNRWGLSAKEWSQWPSNADEVRPLVY